MLRLVLVVAMDRYVKIKKIGAGAFGDALLMRQKETNLKVVIKAVAMGKVPRRYQGL